MFPFPANPKALEIPLKLEQPWQTRSGGGCSSSGGIAVVKM